jgi:branched-chain amino acid transport system permease protein
MSVFAARLTGDVSRQTLIWFAALLAALVIAPFIVDDYLVTVLILILYLAYTGQA